MESVGMLWRLHDMEEVEVNDMGGDSVLICFPSPEIMHRFSQRPPDWVSHWFRSFSPWKQGDKTINRRCWITIRGVPLNTWCQEFFELVGAEFGRLLRMDSDTERRRRLGVARIEILTEQASMIHKELRVSIANSSYSLMVVEETVCHVEVGGTELSESPAMDDRSEEGGFKEDRSETESKHGQEDGDGKESGADFQEETQDPFGIMQILRRNPCPEIGKTVLITIPTDSPSLRRVDSPVTVLESEDDKRGGSRCLQCSQSLASVDLQHEPRPIRLSNSFGPLMGDGEVKSSDQAYNLEQVNVNLNTHSIASSTNTCSSSSDQITSHDSYSFGYLLGKLDNAIKTARVCPRRSFKMTTETGCVTSRSSNIGDTKRMHERIPTSPEQTPAMFVSHVSPVQEAVLTVQIGDALEWEVNGSTKEVEDLAKNLVVKENMEWCASRVDV
ncbi:hypothetical protein Tsubulata_002506 [Turnera subulata]|uniref:DUF4283 domain-containing protein n=1 Tax=Turnera subulata TaxID=218843 RepID=A0A9Q0FJR4_9ROSI|nr:hypothetical protein Tsubulata_002506 [Turnera subulata]